MYVGGTTILSTCLINLGSKCGTTRIPFLTWDAAKNLLMVGFVFFFLGESPVFLQCRTIAASGSPS